MSSEKGHEGGTDSEPGREGRRHWNHQILKKDALAVEILGGLWVGAILGATTLLDDTHSGVRGSLYLAAALASIFVGYIHIRHRRNNKRKINWQVVAPLSCIHIA